MQLLTLFSLLCAAGDRGHRVGAADTRASFSTISGAAWKLFRFAEEKHRADLYTALKVYVRERCINYFHIYCQQDQINSKSEAKIIICIKTKWLKKGCTQIQRGGYYVVYKIRFITESSWELKKLLSLKKQDVKKWFMPFKYNSVFYSTAFTLDVIHVSNLPLFRCMSNVLLNAMTSQPQSNPKVFLDSIHRLIMENMDDV